HDNKAGGSAVTTLRPRSTADAIMPLRLSLTDLAALQDYFKTRDVSQYTVAYGQIDITPLFDQTVPDGLPEQLVGRFLIIAVPSACHRNPATPDLLRIKVPLSPSESC